jgi:hypothetical protein
VPAARRDDGGAQASDLTKGGGGRGLVLVRVPDGGGVGGVTAGTRSRVPPKRPPRPPPPSTRASPSPQESEVSLRSLASLEPTLRAAPPPQSSSRWERPRVVVLFESGYEACMPSTCHKSVSLREAFSTAFNSTSTRCSGRRSAPSLGNAVSSSRAACTPRRRPAPSPTGT